jgi:hypothetical protein
VVGLSILFTDKALISAEERKPKSTLEMESETGVAMFILAANYCTFSTEQARGRFEEEVVGLS